MPATRAVTGTGNLREQLATGQQQRDEPDGERGGAQQRLPGLVIDDQVGEHADADIDTARTPVATSGRSGRASRSLPSETSRSNASSTAGSPACRTVTSAACPGTPSRRPVQLSSVNAATVPLTTRGMPLVAGDSTPK